MGTIIFHVPVALLCLLVVSSIASAQDRDTRALPSANALFREFEDDPINAIDRYVGKAITLEGARGNVILDSDGISAAVHIPDRGTCKMEKFEYLSLWLEDCHLGR